METTNAKNPLNSDSISTGCRTHRFLRNKVYEGLTNTLMKRKTYKTRMGSHNKAISNVFYANFDESFRVEELLLIDKINIIIEELLKQEDIDVNKTNLNIKKTTFDCQHKHFFKEEHSIDEYKVFINEYIDQSDLQSYENMDIKRKLKYGNFEDIVKKIEVYETGILCIFSNGFEMSLMF